MFKEARGGAHMELHQDGIYADEIYENVVTMLVYLTPTGLDGGCLRLVPHSHTMGLLPTPGSGREGVLSTDVCGWDDTLAVPGEPGDCIFTHWNVIHGSRYNLSERDRPVVITRYAGPKDVERTRKPGGMGDW